MSKSRLPMWLGLGAAGAGGYYLYSAGGDPKRATRKLEDDASRATSKMRGDTSGGKSSQKAGEEAGARAGAIADEAVDNARDKAKSVDQSVGDYAKEGVNKLDKVRQDTAREFNAKVDDIDKTVEQKAAEAKGGISSWFGGGKK